MKAFCGLLLLLCLEQSLASDNSQGSNGLPVQQQPLMVTLEAYFDIAIGGVPAGRIVYGLFGDITPKSVLNFVSLIAGNVTGPSGQLVGYKGNIFHRTINNFMIQGGDVTQQNGYGGWSITGQYFPDENFDILHYGPGWIGWANLESIPDTNASQFYITYALTKWLDYKHTIFGVVLTGMDVVRAIAVNPTNAQDRPILPVVITDCGVLPVSQPFEIARR